MKKTYYWGYEVLHYNVFILSFWYTYTDNCIITVIVTLDMTQGKVIRRILYISVLGCNYTKNNEYRPKSNVLYLHSDLHWTNGGICLTHFCKSEQYLILPMVHYIWVLLCQSKQYCILITLSWVLKVLVS